MVEFAPKWRFAWTVLLFCFGVLFYQTPGVLYYSCTIFVKYSYKPCPIAHNPSKQDPNRDFASQFTSGVKILCSFFRNLIVNWNLVIVTCCAWWILWFYMHRLWFSGFSTHLVYCFTFIDCALQIPRFPLQNVVCIYMLYILFVIIPSIS